MAGWCSVAATCRRHITTIVIVVRRRITGRGRTIANETKPAARGFF
jgi:hypothetical protein